MRWVPTGLAAVLLACPAPGLAADQPPTIAELVADLGHSAFRVREAAQRELWRRGEAAVPALERAANGDDPEAARRARELLDTFGRGIRPDTPPAVLKLIRQFRAGDPDPARTDEVRNTAIARAAPAC